MIDSTVRSSECTLTYSHIPGLVLTENATNGGSTTASCHHDNNWIYYVQRQKFTGLQQRIKWIGNLCATNDETPRAFHEPVLLDLIVHRRLQLFHQFLVLHNSRTLRDIPNFSIGWWTHPRELIYDAGVSKQSRRLFDEWMESKFSPRKASPYYVPALPQSFRHAVGYAIWSLEASRRSSHFINFGAIRSIRVDSSSRAYKAIYVLACMECSWLQFIANCCNCIDLDFKHEFLLLLPKEVRI